jgi:menaquinone-specific isochorismate synthase
VLTKEKAELDGPASFTGKLISSVSKIKEKPEPVGLFAAGAKYFKGDRLYWKDPGDNTIFVGFGHVRAYHVRKGDGFAQIEKQWNQLTDRIEIHHVQPEPGTGPVLFGGFAFDQSMEKKEWQAFGQGMFRIPQILFTFKKDTVFLPLTLLKAEKDRGV